MRVLTFLTAVAVAVVLSVAEAASPSVQWSEPTILSDPAYNSWPTTIVTDSAGNVHIMWSQTMLENPPPGEGDTLFYARWDGRNLSPPIDVLTSPEGASVAPELAVTSDGMLHAVWHTGGQTARLMYSRAPACCASDARNWSKPKSIGSSVLSSIAIASDSSDRLHIAYASREPKTIVYSRSDDGGTSWPISQEIPGMLDSDEYPIYPRLSVDGRQRIHVVWSVEPYPGRAVMYARSDDGGTSWSAPHVIDNFRRRGYVDGYGPILVDVEATGEDVVHVMWDGAPTVERNHMWSEDGGVTWSSIQLVFPEVTGVGRAGFNDMAVDASGLLHAVSIHGSARPLYSAWNGEEWSPSQEIPATGTVEYLRIVVSRGNWLFLVGTDKVSKPFRNWFMWTQLAAPELPASLLPTVAPLNLRVSPGDAPSPQSTEDVNVPSLTTFDPPTISGDSSRLSVVWRIVVMLAPVAVLLLLVVIVAANRKQR